MRLLELFSGTGSVGKVARKKGYEVISLDLKNADINKNILDWDYKVYDNNYFDLIWASPPCDKFSNCRNCNIGRRLKNGIILTKEILENEIETIGLPILRKTEEIIDYFNPKYYYIENPQTGRMKDYIDKPFYDVDYCKYSNWGYRKRTRIWTNFPDFIPKICKCDCGNLIPGTKLHSQSIGGGKVVLDNGKVKRIRHKHTREKYKDYKNIQVYVKGGGNNKDERYRIPPKLIDELIPDLTYKNKV